jgi:sugar-specific transcriptional regulator TrmB
MSTIPVILEKLGLDAKEAKVYHSALRLGKATADQIAKEAGVLRTTTYHHIEALMAKGLMTSYTVGKKNFFVAESPTNLTRLIDLAEQQNHENRSLLATALPELISTFSKSGDRPVVRFFPGKEGLTTMREEVLQMEGKELLIISTYEELIKVFSPEERDSFSKRRSDRKISARVIYTKEVNLKAPNYAPRNVRILPPTTSELGFDLYIYDDKICLSSLKNELWGVMITGRAISESIKILFEIAWQTSKEPTAT